VPQAISIVALQPQEDKEGLQPRVPSRPLGDVDMVSCCTIIQRQALGTGTRAGAASDRASTCTLPPARFGVRVFCRFVERRSARDANLCHCCTPWGRQNWRFVGRPSAFGTRFVSPRPNVTWPYVSASTPSTPSAPSRAQSPAPHARATILLRAVWTRRVRLGAGSGRRRHGTPVFRAPGRVPAFATHVEFLHAR
jgi:hypothetical protein